MVSHYDVGSVHPSAVQRNRIVTKKRIFRKKLTTILVYGRPPLVFAGLLCAVAVMWSRDPVLYTVGVVCLFISMSFDLVDGWFAARYHPHAVMAQLADKLMDKIVYSTIFPLVAVGMMWRLHSSDIPPTKTELLHAILVLFLVVAVLVRDSFANFMRGFALRANLEPEHKEFTRLRTIVAAPVSALLYAYAFYIPEGPPSKIYFWISWLGNLPLRGLFFIEISFLVINFGSIAGYCRRYGRYCLDELCEDDERMRRRILSFFPNSLTVMNAMMGLFAVSFAYQGRVREAYLFLIGAGVFDKFDGSVARRLGLTEPLPGEKTPRRITLGGVLDDIADAISFCIAPAWIFYITLSNCPDPVIQKLPIGFAALFYAVLGFVRLIYFTLDKNPIPGFFKGMPTPAGAFFVLAPLVMFSQAANAGLETARFWGILSFGMMIFLGFLMNLYPVRYLHLGRFAGRHPWFGRLSMLVLISLFTPYFGLICFTYMFLYMLSPLITNRIDPSEAARETRIKPADSG